jgi:hypothetical protein
MIKQVQSDQTETKTKSKTQTKIPLLRNTRVLTILEFIKSNENDTGVTMDKVAKYMNEQGICSRPTTLNLLFLLLQEGILLEKKRRNTYFHDLVVNKNYHFEALLAEIFKGHVEEIKESLKPFETLIKDKKIKINYKMDEKELSLSISILQPYQKDEMKRLRSSTDLKPEPHLSSRGEVI